MSKIINYPNPGQYRKNLLGTIYYAILQYKENNNANNKDNAAFILLALNNLETSINETAEAWERRDYWLKADRFRREWAWVAKYKSDLMSSLLSGDNYRVGEIIEDLLSIVGQYFKQTPKKRTVDVRGSWDKLNP